MSVKTRSRIHRHAHRDPFWRLYDSISKVEALFAAYALARSHMKHVCPKVEEVPEDVIVTIIVEIANTRRRGLHAAGRTKNFRPVPEWVVYGAPAEAPLPETSAS
jgi:hypothetical protein